MGGNGEKAGGFHGCTKTHGGKKWILNHSGKELLLKIRVMGGGFSGTISGRQEVRWEKKEPAVFQSQ